MRTSNMQVARWWVTCLLWFCTLLPGAAVAATPVSGEPAVSVPGDAAAIELVVYVRTGCPHCAKAKAFLADLASRRPDVHIVYRPVDEDARAREELVRLSERNGLWPPGVPTFVSNGKVMVGFDDAARSGPDVLALIGPGAAPVDHVETPLFGTLSVSRLGLPVFTLALGLLDGFNPCATWVLLFLLSVLVRVQDRRRMALVAGTFVLASGLVYYAFMAAWLNLFLAVGMSNAVRLALACIALAIGAFNVKDFFTAGRGPSLSIPAEAKPGLVARMHAVLKAEALPASLLAVAILAVIVNFVELLCTAGLPAIYTAVLTQHDVSAAGRYAYLALYIAAYLADDTLMVAVAVIALGSRKLTETGGRWLKLLSGAVMLGLGVVMIVRPQWLLS